jgi:hypothetical protein
LTLVRPLALVCLALLVACQPGLNWREVRIDGSALSLLLPCKPDRATRRISLAGAEVDMHLVSCSAQGGTYAISLASLPATSDVDAAMVHWRRATLAHVAATHLVELPTARSPALKLATRLVRLQGAGLSPAGGALQVEVWWFTQGNQAFQVAVYAQDVGQDMAAMREPLFESLKFQ